MWTMLYNICMKKKNFRKGVKMKIILLFTMIYPKININVVKTILLQQLYADTY